MKYLTLLLLSSAAFAQDEGQAGYSWADRCRDRAQGRMRVCGQNPLATTGAPPAFEFAPVNGAGMGTACACTTPTGSKGEAMTFTRASSATCLKGNLTTGIANGDMVTCSSGQPLIEHGGDGTLGILMEEGRTNTFLWSDAFDNVAWTKLGQGDGTTPVVTADQAIAPSGATTADRVDFSSCTTGRSVVYQIASFNGTGVASVFGKAVGTACSIAVCGSAGQCTRATMQPGSWTRLISPAGSFTNGGTTPFVGNACADEGAAAAACSVYLAADQVEAGAFASSYIATTTVAATRAAASTQIAVVDSATKTVGSAALSYTPLSATLGAGVLAVGDTERYMYGNTSLRNFDGTNDLAASVSLVAGTTARFWSSWAGASKTITQVGGSTNTGAFTGTMGAGTGTTVFVGTYWLAGDFPANGIVSKVCIDPVAARCR